MNIVIPPVPDRYNMVNLHGTDLAEANGHKVIGLYNAISDALDENKIEMFYNWRFADIIIPPAYVVVDDSTLGEFIINEEIRVTSNDTISIIGVSRPPIINSLTVTANGTYAVPLGVDGYSPVIVEVPETPPPVLVSLNATENGLYVPGIGEDGFSDVTVNVPDTPPVLSELLAVENTIYLPPTGVDGFSKVTVNVPPVLSWPSVSEAIEDASATAKIIRTVPYAVPYVSAQIQTFYDTYARTPKPTNLTVDHDYVIGDIYKSMSELVFHGNGELEYYGNIYGNSTIIEDCDLVTLGDFADNSSSGPLTLAYRTSDFSGIVLNGIYNRQRTSVYNTSMLYLPITVGVQYWAGMKDRNHYYDCYVTFLNDLEVTLSGNKQVIIYGIP